MDFKINVEEMNKLNNKLNIYKNEELLLIQDFMDVFLQISHFYKNDNNKLLDELTDSLINKIKIIDKNNYNYMKYIDKNVSSYLLTSQKVDKIFDDLLK